MNKGQLFSLDFLSAIFIFMMVFVILLLYWGSYIDNIAKYSERKDMEIYANRIADFFASSGGKPSNWEDDTDYVVTIGLASLDRTIDEDKLNAFMGMDYDDIRDKLMIGGYNFCFRLVFSSIEKCDFGPGDEMVAFSSRAVSYNGNNDILQIFVWRYL